MLDKDLENGKNEKAKKQKYPSSNNPQQANQTNKHIHLIRYKF